MCNRRQYPKDNVKQTCKFDGDNISMRPMRGHCEDGIYEQWTYHQKNNVIHYIFGNTPKISDDKKLPV